MSDWDNFDEFDAVRDFRATLGTLETDTSDRIRARIVELARQRGAVDTTGDHDGLIILEPTLDLREPDQPPRVPAPTRSLDDASAAAVVELHAARQPSALRPTRLMAAAAAIFVVILAGTVVVRGGLRSETQERIDAANSPTTQQAISLADLAELARSRADAPLLVGQFLHTKQRIGNLTTRTSVPMRAENVREQWADIDGHGRLHIGPTTTFSFDASPTSVVSGEDASTPLAAGSTPFAGLTYEALRSLPADGAGVRAKLRESLPPTATDLDPVLLRNQLELLILPITKPEVKAAIFDALSAQGFAAVGDSSIGSVSGLGFELAAGDGTTFTLVVDGVSGLPLGYQQTVVDSTISPVAAPTGTVLTLSTFELPTITTEAPA